MSSKATISELRKANSTRAIRGARFRAAAGRNRLLCCATIFKAPPSHPNLDGGAKFRDARCEASQACQVNRQALLRRWRGCLRCERHR